MIEFIMEYYQVIGAVAVIVVCAIAHNFNTSCKVDNWPDDEGEA